MYLSLTACHPAVHNLLFLERDKRMIRSGLNFYTMDTNFLKSTLISSRNNINLIEGMSVAFLKQNLFDLTIYLYTDGDTELIRRGMRDVSEIGADFNYIKKSHEQRRIQYELFMHSFHKDFDIVIKTSNELTTIEKCKI